jgi:adenosine deaminase
VKSKTLARTILLLLACATFAQTSQPKQRPGSAEAATASYFAKIRTSPLLLHAFLWKMPKGGDLHNHLSGAAYAEHFIQIAADQNLCIERKTLTVEATPCAAPANCDTNAATESAKCALSDPLLYRELVDAWSMRDFTPQIGDESGHDHFFDTFGKFGSVSNATGDLLAEVVGRAAEQNEQYLELMLTPGIGAASDLGARHGWQQRPDEAEIAYFDRMRQDVANDGIPEIVANGRKWLDEQESRMRQQLRCGEPRQAGNERPGERPGCKVTVRYIAEILRGLPKQVVFAQMAASFEMAKQDKRVLSVNPVMPEDAYVPMHDYDLHMRMFAYFHKFYPDVKLTMHAGELAPGLVPPRGLHDHIRDAIEVGGAQRIGHGVDVMYEDNPLDLLREMAQKKVAVEICLTSNDVILNVRGDHHPFPIYMQYGVPVVIATDDEGVSRSDMTREYERAVETYGLTYPKLKQIVRNSLEYSFLPPDEKTKEKQELEAAFAAFEREMTNPKK